MAAADRSPRAGRVGIVAAGAGARGAYEAGALSVLLPELAARGRRPRVFVGTSAGAINAALLASLAHLDPHEAGEQLLDVWRTVARGEVFRSVLRSGLPTAARYVAEVAGVPRARVTGLLDTAPLRRTAEDRVDWARLHDNVAHGHVDALAIVATSARAGRSTVFVERDGRVGLPRGDDGRALDYVDATIAPEHVLASCAIPLAFPPVRVHTPAEAAGWYTDGGVRLNAPLKPALALGVDHLAVVATHPEVYPARPTRPAPDDEQPDLDDAAVHVVDAALVDRMVEDIRTLGKVNELVAGGGRRGAGREYEVVPYIFIGPKRRRALGEIAGRVYRERHGGLRALKAPDFFFLHRLLGPGEPHAADLLSYVFFDRDFVDAAINLGRRDATNRLRGGGDPWRIGPPR